MRVDVHGLRLFFDVEGAALVPDGDRMRARPTLLLLHGGPGMDHAHLRAAFSPFADIAQVVYLDHRGNGRSDRAAPGSWTVAQWGDDVRAFCDALEIERPVVLGVSFGGVVAMSYATRHPGHAGKLVLASTEARYDEARTLAAFGRLGGAEAQDAARRFLAGDASAMDDYARHCLPLYLRRKPRDEYDRELARCIANLDVMRHYFTSGEASRVDLVAALPRIDCPTLILAGEDDPITPPESHEEIAAAMRPGIARLLRFPDTGHTVFDDEPRSLEAVRDFVLS